MAKVLSKFSQKEISYAFKSARCVYKEKRLTVLSAKRQCDFARILIVTPRSVGNAPQRNKLRRQLKAIFYENKLYNGSSDYIVLLKPKATTLTFSGLRTILTN